MENNLKDLPFTCVLSRRCLLETPHLCGITKLEQEALFDLLRIRRNRLLDSDPTIEGFNIGINSGKVAGQDISHCHVHLIPRRSGELPVWDHASKSK